MILGAIDLGTNTARLMVAEVTNDAILRVLYRDREIVRLGEGFSKEKKILSKSLDKAIEAINRFTIKARAKGAERITLIGTSALREAKNGEQVQESLARKTGLMLKTISGEMEAMLTSYGAIKTLALPASDLVVVDVGGGSSEFSYFPSVGSPVFLSLSLGVVWLTEKFLINDPPAMEEYEQMYSYCLNTILRQITSLSFPFKIRLVGTGGTAATLAGIKQKLSLYDPEKINNFTISLEDLKELETSLCILPVRQREKIPGLEKGRTDIIIAGIALFIAFMKSLKVHQMIISDGGLLEGIILNERHRDAEAQRQNLY